MFHLELGFWSLWVVRVGRLVLVLMVVVVVGVRIVMSVWLLRGLARQVGLGLIVPLRTSEARAHRRIYRVVARVLEKAAALGSFRLVVMRYRTRIIRLGQVMATAVQVIVVL